MTSLKINRLLPMATINMHMKFEIEIPKQTWLMLRKPCRLQTDGQTDRRTRWIQYTPPPPPTSLGGGIIMSLSPTSIKPLAKQILMYPGNINWNLSYNFNFEINQTSAFITWKLNIYFLKCLIYTFSCDQAALWMVFSVRPSYRPSVTPFSLCSHHHIIRKFSGIITNDESGDHAKGQGQRSRSHRSKPNLTISGP